MKRRNNNQHSRSSIIFLIISMLLALILWIWPAPLNNYPHIRTLVTALLVAFAIIILSFLFIENKKARNLMIFMVIIGLATVFFFVVPKVWLELNLSRNNILRGCVYVAGEGKDSRIENPVITIAEKGDIIVDEKRGNDQGEYEFRKLKLNTRYSIHVYKGGFHQNPPYLKILKIPYPDPNEFDIRMSRILAITREHIKDLSIVEGFDEKVGISFDAINAEGVSVSIPTFKTQTVVVGFNVENNGKSPIWIDIGSLSLRGLDSERNFIADAIYDYLSSSLVENPLPPKLRLKPGDKFHGEAAFTFEKMMELPLDIFSVEPYYLPISRDSAGVLKSLNLRGEVILFNKIESSIIR